MLTGQRRSRFVVRAQRKDQQQTVWRYGRTAQTRVELRAHRNEVVLRVQQASDTSSAYPSRNEADPAEGDGEDEIQ